MSNDIRWSVNLKPGLGKQLKGAMRETVTEFFELDLLPDAKELSPVSATYPSIPASRGEPRIDTGTNRRSLDVEINDTPQGTEAVMFSQSGYGGYIEKGTTRIPARPYMWRSWVKNKSKLAKIWGKKFAALAVKGQKS